MGAGDLEGPRMTSIVVVDDHPAVVAGVRAWCQAAEPPIEVLDSGSSVSVAWLDPGDRADVVVLDLQLDITGPAYGDLKRLVDAGRQVVVYTMREDRETALTCLDIGAFTYLTKAEGEDHLVGAGNGDEQIYIHPRIPIREVGIVIA